MEITCFTLFLLAFLVGCIKLDQVCSAPQVPCFFIFGDSLVDNGNNNNMASLAKANYAPYGIDFPEGSTGRFCNGKTTVDVLTELLGFENYIPPYSAASGMTILGGVNVNYASAAAGIRTETGRQLGGRTDFTGQVRNYIHSVSQLVRLFDSEDAAADHLSKCIFSVGMGSNDYHNNYFMPAFYPTSTQYTTDQFDDVLLNQYTQQLRILYYNGARKVVIVGVGRVGCIPNQLARYSSDGVTCVGHINNAIQIFNNKMVSVVDQFNQNFPGANFTFINSYNMLDDALRNPSDFGFKVTNAGCCGVGRNNGQITCLPVQAPCANRKEYVFWDAFHPTEAANAIIGRRSYKAESPNDAHPVDIHTLAEQ